MKKNLILLFVLMIMLVGTFFLKEKFIFFREDKSGTPLKDGIVLKKIIFPSFELDFPNGFGKDEGLSGKDKLPLNKGAVDGFLSLLSNIHIEREIQFENLPAKEVEGFERSFDSIGLNLDFRFNDGRKLYRLGERQSNSELFYIHYKEWRKEQLTKNIILLARGNFPKELYDPKNPNLDLNYIKMKNLFNSPLKFFLDKKVLKSWGHISKVEIKNHRNRDFVLDLENFTTIPKALEGVEYNLKKFEVLISFFKNLYGINVYPFDESQDLLDLKVSEIVITGINNSVLKLYKRFNSKEGYFLNYKNKVFELDPKTTAVFFSNVQNFWYKKPFGIKNRPKIKEDLDISLSQNGESEDFVIPFDAKFTVLKDGKSVPEHIRREFLNLFLLIFGGSSEKESNESEAFRVRKLFSQQDRSLFNSPNSLVLKVLGKKLKLLKQEEEILILDMDSSVIYHYPMDLSGNSQISLNLNSYL